MSLDNRLERECYWREQVALADTREGSLESYCRTQGVAIHTLRYWKEKFRSQEKKSKSLVVPAFIPVEISKGPKAEKTGRLPDARWCADFVRYLFEGAE
jgi:hypothetical protein